MLTRLLLITLMPCFLIAEATPAKPVQAPADPAALVQESFFTHPGLVFQSGGQWVGDDDLYNLNNQIELYIDVQKTANTPYEVDQSKIKSVIATLFKKGSIGTNPSGSLPHYPFFNLLIMIAPIEKGYVINVSGRLFENVTLERFFLEKNTYYQAITWEKQALVVVGKEKVDEELLNVVQDITSNFVERYRHFEEIKLRKSLK